jgi:hypothetical protein
MMTIIKNKLAALSFLACLATGCSSTGGMSNLFPAAGDNPIKIESEPSGAEVYVMGEKLGVTPLKISHQDVFPNIYPKEKLSLYGRVTLKKSGCSNFTRTVSSEISNGGLRAQLDCVNINPTSFSHSSENLEQRLEKIKELLNKGLISEEEAKKAREHVLNDL